MTEVEELEADMEKILMTEIEQLRADIKTIDAANKAAIRLGWSVTNNVDNILHEAINRLRKLEAAAAEK